MITDQVYRSKNLKHKTARQNDPYQFKIITISLVSVNWNSLDTFLINIYQEIPRSIVRSPNVPHASERTHVDQRCVNFQEKTNHRSRLSVCSAFVHEPRQSDRFPLKMFNFPGNYRACNVSSSKKKPFYRV